MEEKQEVEISEELLGTLNSTQKLMCDKNNLLKLKAYMEIQYNDNEIFRQYVDILKQIDNIEKQEKQLKDELYNKMTSEKCKNWEGDNIKVTLKEQYTKKQLNKQFFEDNKETSRLFKKYIDIVPVKGNVTIKYKED